jgi:hypothetical protein
METVENCPHCQDRLEVEKAQEEMQFAFLLALVPLMVVTLFAQMGLF